MKSKFNIGDKVKVKGLKGTYSISQVKEFDKAINSYRYKTIDTESGVTKTWNEKSLKRKNKRTNGLI